MCCFSLIGHDRNRICFAAEGCFPPSDGENQLLCDVFGKSLTGKVINTIHSGLKSWLELMEHFS
jgi:hypothetical protein